MYETRNGFEGRKRRLKAGTGEIQILCMLRRWRESEGRHGGVYANSESHFSLRLQSIGKWAGYLCRIWGSLQQNRGLHPALDILVRFDFALRFFAMNTLKIIVEG